MEIPNIKDYSVAKIVVTLAAGAYFLQFIANPDKWTWLNGANLIFHEAGHPLFSIFGYVPGVAGGTLMQLIIPIVCIIYFAWKKSYYSASLLLLWLGQSLIDVSRYAGDAIVMQLPLLGGDNSIHDWNYMLIYFGQLRHAHAIAQTIFITGAFTIILGIVLSLFFSKKSPGTLNTQTN